MSGYGARAVAKMLGLSVGQVRAYVRAGFLEPARGPRGELRFSFQDLVLLRAAQGLLGARIAGRRVRAVLRKLRTQLPEGRTLRDVHIRAEGDRIVVGDGARKWSAEDGQILFDFGTAELARRIAPLARKRSSSLDADGMYERGCDLEEADPAAARAAYERALQLDPEHAQALVNLGRRAEAIDAYQLAITTDPHCADAHYNLSRLYEHLGQGAPALRHLRTYRALTGHA